MSSRAGIRGVAVVALATLGVVVAALVAILVVVWVTGCIGCEGLTGDPLQDLLARHDLTVEDAAVIDEDLVIAVRHFDGASQLVRFVRVDVGGWSVGGEVRGDAVTGPGGTFGMTNDLAFGVGPEGMDELELIRGGGERVTLNPDTGAWFVVLDTGVNPGALHLRATDANGEVLADILGAQWEEWQR